jgi:hypothetical protein
METIKKRNNLRNYFFRNNPNAAWAIFLWEGGFLSSPPEPNNAEHSFALPYWDAQYYLISVAQQVPEIVLKHVEAIQGHGWYLARAIESLSKIPVEYSEKALPIVLTWLTNSDTAEILQKETLILISVMANHGKLDVAFKLFDSLSAPRKESRTNRNRDSYKGLFDYDEYERTGAFELLKKKNALLLIQILEKHLMSSLYGEEGDLDASEPLKASWWRNAVEDTEQDSFDQYQDYVLRALRDTLLEVIENDVYQGREIVIRYLHEHHVILRRLGLYIIGQFPVKFHEDVVRELLDQKNLDDSFIHHEFFLLLGKGFAELLESEKKLLIVMILDGPELEQAEKFYESYRKVDQPDREKYLSNWKKGWIRDRLWIIHDQLDNETKYILDNLVKEGGKPEHPAFLAWSSGGFWIADVSPYSEHELSKFTPDQLYEFIKSWRPDPKEQFGPECISYKGFADEIAKLVCSFSDRYKERLVDMALFLPEYGVAIFNYWASPKFTDPIPWANVISLCEGILSDDGVWNNEAKQGFDGELWRNVRMAIAGLLEISVTNENKKIPNELIDRVQTILFQLIDDLDPTIEADRPLDGWFGHNDPGTVALNHVRPISLSALIYCAVLSAKRKNLNNGIDQNNRVMQSVLQEKLSKKLDPHLEPSRAVRSVFGRLLLTLYWLDQTWLVNNLDLIFPTKNDDESIWLFISAWDSYIAHNKFYRNLFEALRSKYSQSIEYLSQGYKTESHLGQAANLAGHLLFEYLFSELTIDDFVTQGSLIVDYFAKTQPEIRGRAPWALWRICESNPDKLGKFWPKAKALWEWRTKEAVISNHSLDFNEEMLEFAQLLDVAPAFETISSLSYFLNGLLPYLRNVENHNIGWRAIEIFLARQAEHEPVEAINFYSLLCEQKYPPPKWVYHSDEAKKIIEITVANPKSQMEALALIDFFAKHWNDYTFESLYQQFAR